MPFEERSNWLTLWHLWLKVVGISRLRANSLGLQISQDGLEHWRFLLKVHRHRVRVTWMCFLYLSWLSLNLIDFNLSLNGFFDRTRLLSKVVSTLLWSQLVLQLDAIAYWLRLSLKPIFGIGPRPVISFWFMDFFKLWRLLIVWSRHSGSSSFLGRRFTLFMGFLQILWCIRRFLMVVGARWIIAFLF